MVENAWVNPRVRSNYWDGWKGLCIVAVVALHAYPTYDGATTGTWHWYAGFLSYEFLNILLRFFSRSPASFRLLTLAPLEP